MASSPRDAVRSGTGEKDRREHVPLVIVLEYVDTILRICAVRDRLKALEQRALDGLGLGIPISDKEFRFAGGVSQIMQHGHRILERLILGDMHDVAVGFAV